MILNLKNNSLIIFLIVLIAALIFIPFIGNCPLFDWDEVNFAECAREMVVSGNYSRVQLNFRPFWEKPPFFIWLQAASMTIFGVNEFAARFPNAICSIVSLIAIYLIGKKFHSQKFGIIWSLIYAATLLPHLYFKSGLIDPWFNLFIFLSVFNSIQFLNNPNGKKEIYNSLLAGLFLGTAVLTKGPAAIVIVGLTLLVYSIWNRQLKLFLSKPFIIFAITTIIVSGSWFFIEWLKGNQDVIKEFIDYQIRLLKTEDSGHSGPFIYHFVVLLIGCFPASLIFIASYFNFRDLTPYQKQFRKMFISLFWVVILLFSFAQTKIVHYSSLCYYPLTFIAALGLVQNFERIKFNTALKIIYWLVAVVFTLAFTIIAFINVLKPIIIKSGIIKDEFALLNLQADVNWTGFESLIALVFLIGAILIFVGINKHKIKLLYYGFFFNLIFIYLIISCIVPKIELYTQHAAIEFYKAVSKHDCHIETHGFKSYAYLFYSNRMPEDYSNKNQIKITEELLHDWEKDGLSPLTSFPLANLYWMEHYEIEKPAYIIAKKQHEEELSLNPELTKLYSKNGFSFFVRMPNNTAN
ncbi:MAG: glycosyltransferase family 39 protein [Bacteroidota bacterium]|nr:glycosyltransferase family 39 protein [Bacteroidota bacterium]